MSKLLACLLLLAGCLALTHGCQRLYRTTDRRGGVLASSNGFPYSCGRNYYHNQRCSYTLVDASDNRGEGVRISFNWLSLERGYDYLRIMYTNQAGHYVTGYFTGSIGPLSYNLPAKRGTSVRLYFHTDRSVAASGFLLRYSVGSTAPPTPSGGNFRINGTVRVGSDGGVRGYINAQPARMRSK